MSDVNIVMVILMTTASLAAFWLAAIVQELLREKNLLLRRNARQHQALTNIAKSTSCEVCQELRIEALEALEDE